MVSAVHLLSEESSTNLMDTTGVGRQGRNSGSDDGDTWSAVCGGDHGSSHGHEQD